MSFDSLSGEVSRVVCCCHANVLRPEYSSYQVSGSVNSIGSDKHVNVLVTHSGFNTLELACHFIPVFLYVKGVVERLVCLQIPIICYS